MFGLRKSERAAYEGHIQDLQEQIHWLRSCLPWVVPMGGPTRPGSAPGAAPPPLALLDPTDDPPRLHMSEEEEDVHDALRRGDLDTEEAKAILRTLGLNDEIELA